MGNYNRPKAGACLGTGMVSLTLPYVGPTAKQGCKFGRVFIECKCSFSFFHFCEFEFSENLSSSFEFRKKSDYFKDVAYSSFLKYFRVQIQVLTQPRILASSQLRLFEFQFKFGKKNRVLLSLQPCCKATEICQTP